MKVLYLGFNSFVEHKRGVENVIDFQSKSCDFESIYYIHWGSKTIAYKNNKFICISIKHCWYWPIFLNRILFRIKRENEIIIHSHNPLFSVFSFFKTDIFTVHDGLYYQNKSKKRKLVFLFRITEILLYHKCTQVHFISLFTKKQTLFGDRRNFVIIPNTSHFEQYVHLADQIGNRSNSKLILSVRSIEERARIDLLLHVAVKLKGTDYRFIVAGKGPLLGCYQNEILEKKITNVEMIGYVDDAKLLDLYSKCDLVMMIAEFGEGFGLPIIEGYLFNKPVIASNCCAIPEVIVSDDYLFANDVDSIIRSISYALSIQNMDYYSYYKSKYSNAIILARFKELYINISL